MDNNEQMLQMEFRLGQLTGLVTAVQTTQNDMAKNLAAMDSRLRQNEAATISLAVKIGLIAIACGGVGSFAVSLVLKYL